MRSLAVALSSLLVLACSDSSLEGGANAGGAPTGAGNTGGSPPSAGAPAGGEAAGGEAAGGAGPQCEAAGGATGEDFTTGGSRPVLVDVPDGYDPNTPAPLLILLHGYTASGDIQEAYFQLAPLANENGMVYAHPDGMKDANNSQFWNASDACCDFGNTNVDDSGYLGCLIDAIEARVNIDPKRIYFVGHSNGGFMSYRMACDHADKIAAFASLAGAMPLDTSVCTPSEPVSALQIHGTVDGTIAYDGGSTVVPFPSAPESISFWAALGGCDATAVDDPTLLDLDSAVAGDETTVSIFPGCDAGIDVELWTLTGSGHVPGVTDDFRNGVVDWLLAHPKP
jgi:polyhydroxybutyrate depolymerase